MRFILTIFTLAALFAPCAGLHAAQPNVLFIAVDDLNDWIGCFGGHPQTKTPNLDRLAASSVLFRNAVCPAASCNPSAAWPHAAITHLDKPENYAITTERWRYLHYLDGSEELYDIHTDPHEWTNLATKREHAAKLAELRLLAPKPIAPIHVPLPK